MLAKQWIKHATTTIAEVTVAVPAAVGHVLRVNSSDYASDADAKQLHYRSDDDDKNSYKGPEVGAEVSNKLSACRYCKWR